MGSVFAYYCCRPRPDFFLFVRRDRKIRYVVSQVDQSPKRRRKEKKKKTNEQQNTGNRISGGRCGGTGRTGTDSPFCRTNYFLGRKNVVRNFRPYSFKPHFLGETRIYTCKNRFFCVNFFVDPNLTKMGELPRVRDPGFFSLRSGPGELKSYLDIRHTSCFLPYLEVAVTVAIALTRPTTKTRYFVRSHLYGDEHQFDKP